MPFWYSNTVMFANPTVSFSKRSGGVEALAPPRAKPRSRAASIILRFTIPAQRYPTGSAGRTISPRRLGEIAEATEFFVAFFQQLIDRDFEQALKICPKRFAQNFCGLFVITMRARIRLRH